MADSTMYEVVGACVTDIPVGTATGPMRTTVYKGAQLSSEAVPAERLAHLLDVGLIRELEEGQEPVPPEAEAGLPPEQRTAERRPVNARSSKGDLVEHAVAQGMDRGEAEAKTRDELLGLYVRQPESRPAE